MSLESKLPEQKSLNSSELIEELYLVFNKYSPEGISANQESNLLYLEHIDKSLWEYLVARSIDAYRRMDQDTSMQVPTLVFPENDNSALCNTLKSFLTIGLGNKNYGEYATFHPDYSF